MKKILIVLLILLLPAIVFADFSVTFKNTSDSKMFYLFFWVSHPFDWQQPAHMAGGELNASESIDLNVDYKPGSYYVIWRDTEKRENEISVRVKDSVSSIMVTPKEILF